MELTLPTEKISNPQAPTKFQNQYPNALGGIEEVDLPDGTE